MKKRTIAVLIMALILSLKTVCAYNELDINYWYSNSNEVAFWSSVPNAYALKLNSNYSFAFDGAFSHARTQWNGAGVVSAWTTLMNAANIMCYGGTYSQIYSYTGVNVPITDSGLTSATSVFSFYLNWIGQTKYLYRNTSATVYIVDLGADQDHLFKTFTHELGHAMGWEGHSSEPTDVMYAYSSGITTLTDRDKDHLSQFY